MTWLRVLSVAVFPLSITGCYMSGSITNIDGSNPTTGILGKIPTMENVAGSSQYQITPLTGFRVRHSAGLVMSKQMGVTAQGFRVYSNVSGKITSQELNQ